MAYWQTEEEITIKDETGEILKQESKKRGARVIKEPPYFKVYLPAFKAFKEVEGISTKFLYILIEFTLPYANDGATMYLNPALKRKIAAEIGWSKKSALSRCNGELIKLNKQKVIKRIDRDTYVLNPNLIGIGDWQDIERLRTATFDLWTGKITYTYKKDENKKPNDEVKEKIESIQEQFKELKEIEEYCKLMEKEEKIDFDVIEPPSDEDEWIKANIIDKDIPDPTEEERRAGYNGTKTYDEEIAG